MRKLALIIVAALFGAILLAGCSAGSSGPNKPSISQQANQDTQLRADAMAKAEALYPAPQMRNFPLRKALVTLTERQDEVNHPWYIYLQAAQTGQVIAYYVAKTAPQNECNTLSSTQSVQHYDNGQGGSNPIILDAPTYNGIYAGGAGASGSCSTFFFQDESTGAIVELFGDNFIVMDQPLALNVPRLKVNTN